MKTVGLTWVIVVTICLFTNIAHAQIRRQTEVQLNNPALEPVGSCTKMVDDLVNYAKQLPPPGEKRWIAFQLVMNAPDMKWSQYAAGTLSYKESPTISAVLSGEGRQYFSDRVWSAPDFPSAEGNPFNPAKTDRLELYIEPEGGPRKELVAVFRLANWDVSAFGHMTTPQCSKGFMYGFLDDAMYILSFKKGGYRIN